MRIFSSASEAVREVERDLWEMGTRVNTRSYQDKVNEQEGFTSYELVGYSFTLTNRGEDWENIFKILRYPDAAACVRYVDSEWRSRLSLPNSDEDPTRLRRNVWDNFREEDGKFAYTYRERMCTPVRGNSTSARAQVHGLHINDPHSRQLVIPIYSGVLDNERRGGKRRVPCTMYYQVLDRGNEFYFIHNMRSCDLYTHFPIDMMVSWFMAEFFLRSMSEENAKCPKLVMTFGSLHAFEKDLKARQIF